VRIGPWLGVLPAIVALAVAACGYGDEGSRGSSGGGGEKPQLTVSAAASLKTAFEEYGKEFSDATVRFSFAGSDELAAQIEQGVKPDVYAAANTKLPDELYSKGLMEKPRVFAGNELVLAVPADSDIDAPEDLTDEGVTIAIGRSGPTRTPCWTSSPRSRARRFWPTCARRSPMSRGSRAS
jgi:molybdate transport system substrate-binding protein